VTLDRGTPRLGFVLEQTLGHITHASNLRALAPTVPGADVVFADVPFDVSGLAARVPGYGNWTLRAGLRARRLIRRLGHVDALFIHTQVPALMCVRTMRRVPTVVSLDATPLQYDDLGAQYDHRTGSARVERVKWHLNRRCFMAASALVTWSHWTKADLVDRYLIPGDKIHVIPPGVDVDRWAEGSASDRGRAENDPVRVLFVGGDFARKGGPVLIDAVRRLRSSGLLVEVDLVTRDPVTPESGVRVHLGMRPNSPELIDLYHSADIFCLPTLGDCLPMVLCEAATVGLPLVSTDVGAISEVVRDHDTGRLVPVHDAAALADAIGELVRDPALRRSLGEQARLTVRDEFNAATSAHQLVCLLRSLVVGR
jgi:glycosyltransferase involved in cell wall biosynthesis